MTAFSVNAQITSIALVGPASDGCWPDQACDTFPIDPSQLIQIDADNWKIEGKVLAVGPCKLRANNAWSVPGGEWAGAFPTAVGTSSGDINIPIAGTYTITLNTSTNVFNFDSGTPLSVVKLVGTAVTGGTITMNPSSPTVFTLPLTTLLTGSLQFEVDGALSGGDAVAPSTSSFPTGVLAAGPTPLIAATAGNYTSITLDLGTGEYSFVAAPLNAQISITGSAATGIGWGNDTADFAKTDIDNYYLENVALEAINGCKFRKDHDWAVTWGNNTPAGWPSAISNGENITPAIAGNYDAFLNITTGLYNFAWPTIALVGPGAGGWPSDPQVDANVLTTTDGLTYTKLNQVLTAGPIKFRSANSWSGNVGQRNWGGAIFLSDIGVYGGGNIPAEAGTYDVTFNRKTGAYTFTPSNLATSNFATAGFNVSPNPTNTTWNFTSAKEAIVSVQVIDMLGKVVATSTSAIVDASALNTGVYFAKVTSANATATVKVVRN